MNVDVWCGRPSQERSWHAELLTDLEQKRASTFRQASDRARFTVATALLRLVVAERLGLTPARVPLDRTCDDCGQPHGRPRLPGHDTQVSISHSGDRVLVAVVDGPPVGVDVEQISTSVDGLELASHVLAAEEYDEYAVTGVGFVRYWTRKEAVVKATGDGLRMPLTEVVVTAPASPPELLRYGDRRDLAATISDVPVGNGYAAAVAVLTSGPIRVAVRDGAGLLDRAAGDDNRAGSEPGQGNGRGGRQALP